MFEEPSVPVTDAMLAEGLVIVLEEATMEAFLAREGLLVIFFPGPGAVRREAHDVAVALRELLRLHAGSVSAALVGQETDVLRERLRVTATPCLVFVAGGEVLQVMPRVRDWADYSAAFQRYLGTPEPMTNLLETA